MGIWATKTTLRRMVGQTAGGRAGGRRTADGGQRTADRRWRTDGPQRGHAAGFRRHVQPEPRENPHGSNAPDPRAHGIGAGLPHGGRPRLRQRVAAGRDETPRRHFARHCSEGPSSASDASRGRARAASSDHRRRAQAGLPAAGRLSDARGCHGRVCAERRAVELRDAFGDAVGVSCSRSGALRCGRRAGEPRWPTAVLA